jgi:HEAT repeat protein
MSSKNFLRVPVPSFCAAALLLAAGCAAPSASPTAPEQPAATASAPAPDAALKSLDYSGSQSALQSLDRSIAAAGTDRTKLSAIIAELVEVLKQPDATFTAQQAAAQRLGQLLPQLNADDATLTTVEHLLTDERLVNVARLALEPIPGEATDATFLRAFGETSGGTRVAIIQSIGNRRIANAVALLAPLLKNSDEPTASAAAKALGQIGTAAALAALEGAPDSSVRPVIEARLACAWSLRSASDAIAAFQRVLADAQTPATYRVLALRGVLGRDPPSAPAVIFATLAGNDPAAKRVALEAISALPASAIVAPLAAKLSAFDAPTQAAAINALAASGDAAAVAAVSHALTDTDSAVRAAALAALGKLPGSREVALQLAQFLVTAAGDEAKLARQSLARLNGPGVNDAILATAADGEAKLRVVMLEAVALRNLTEAFPLLWKIRGDPDATVRAAALRSLGELAPASDQAAILAWTIAATDPQEIARAQRALASISLRNHDEAVRDRLVIDAVDHGTAEIQLRLLPVLTRLGSAAAAECAGRLSCLTDTNVAAAATDTLSRWPERNALPVLITTAERASLDDVRTAAIKGAIGFIERKRETPAKESPDDVARLLAATKDLEARKSLLVLLGRGTSDTALTLAEKLQSDPALAAEARDAALSIRVNRMWPPAITASASNDQAGRMVDGNAKTAWSVPATAGQWIQIDCKQARPVHRITLDQTGRVGDYPGTVEVFVTDDLANPGTARATASGRRDKTVIELPAGIRGRFIIIKSTARRGGGAGNWSVTELQID